MPTTNDAPIMHGPKADGREAALQKAYEDHLSKVFDVLNYNVSGDPDEAAKSFERAVILLNHAYGIARKALHLPWQPDV